jgi:hypothetical protein
MPFLIENITMNPIKVGGWYDDYNKEAAKEIKTLLPGHRLEIDEGALNNPVIRDLQRRRVIRISEVDLIPLKSQENEWEDLQGDIGLTAGLPVIIKGSVPTPLELPNMSSAIWVDTTSGCRFLAFRYLGVLYTVELSPH